MAQALVEETQCHNAAETARKPPTICWYRSPIDRELMKSLHERNDLLAWMQSLGHLGLIVATGAASWYSAYHWHWAVTLALIYLHGTFYSFAINAVHELGHGTVFKTKTFNKLFERIFAFLGFFSHEMFSVSHAKHHRYTLHPPDDLEQVLPIKIYAIQFLKYGIVNIPAFFAAVKDHIRIARGGFAYGASFYPGIGRDGWELELFPENEPERRRVVIQWARILLVGHALIVILAVAMQWWMLIVLVTLAPYYGGLLSMFCNSTQHTGLTDNTNDFRLCCRTVYLSAPVRFLYWYMNYHIEHHMYAAVPCYNLHKLHEAIKHDLAPCPDGLVAAWREIFAILRKQEEDPNYQYAAPVPVSPQVQPAQG